MGRDESGNALNRAHRRRFLLSGLLVCGCCGAGYTIMAKDRYGCAGRRSKGTCTNDRTISRQEIEARILKALKQNLLTPELVAEFTRAYQEEVNRLTKEASGKAAEVEIEARGRSAQDRRHHARDRGRPVPAVDEGASDRARRREGELLSAQQMQPRAIAERFGASEPCGRLPQEGRGAGEAAGRRRTQGRGDGADPLADREDRTDAERRAGVSMRSCTATWRASSSLLNGRLKRRRPPSRSVRVAGLQIRRSPRWVLPVEGYCQWLRGQDLNL